MQIRLPEGWRVEHNSFFDEEPVLDAGICTNLSEDLLQLSRGAAVIDVGYYRDRYRVIQVHGADWEHPQRTQECATRHEVIDVIHEWTADLS